MAIDPCRILLNGRVAVVTGDGSLLVAALQPDTPHLAPRSPSGKSTPNPVLLQLWKLARWYQKPGTGGYLVADGG